MLYTKKRGVIFWKAVSLYFHLDRRRKKMGYGFDEIMAYHPDNKIVYEEIKDNLSILCPFVGSGVTAFAFPTWSNALKLISKKITTVSDRRRVLEKIKSKDYLEAAQLLEKLRTPSNLSHDLVNLFNRGRLLSKQAELRRSALVLLPFLFHGLIITTNYDQTLEDIYGTASNPFEEVILPGRTELLTQIQRGNHNHYLYKFHGSISGNNIEYGSIVFTQHQYDIHYGSNSPLPAELSSLYNNKVMLFIGCSLEKDRTMEVLENILSPGVTNYAILSCAKNKRDEKTRELGSRNIRAILYEKGKHDALRVIFENLLQETNPEQYSCLPEIVGRESSLPSAARFTYQAEKTDMIGREAELNSLKDMISVPEKFIWWAITGPGGCGKSRLAYELRKHLPTGWSFYYLNQEDYGRLQELHNDHTVYIADYVQAHIESLAIWMDSLSMPSSTAKIRLLLIERDADSTDRAYSWVNQLFEATQHAQVVRSLCYSNAFLKIQPLNDNQLYSLIQSYSSKIGGRRLSVSEQESVVKKLHLFDPDLCRPLWAMILADTLIKNKDALQWSDNNILDYVLKRENKRLSDSICQQLGIARKNRKLLSSCLSIQRIATVFDGVKSSELPELSPNSWGNISDSSKNYNSPEEFLHFLGLATEGKITALRPDLLGEFDIYNWIIESNSDDKELFFSSIWQRPHQAAFFFTRLFRDFKTLLNKKPEQLLLFLPNCNLPKDEIKWHTHLLVNATSCTQSKEVALKIVCMLERITNQQPELSEVVLDYAAGLVNLSNKQSSNEATLSLEKLRLLYEQHPNIPALVPYYAKGLVNLTIKQDIDEAKCSVKALHLLSSKHSDQIETAREYAHGLFGLSYKQSLDEAFSSTEDIHLLVKEHNDDINIALVYAKSLVILISKQKLPGAMDSVEKLKCLYKHYLGDGAFSLEFAKGIVNLSKKQTADELEKSAKDLHSLFVFNDRRVEFAIMYAKGLVNLSDMQDTLKKRVSTLKDIERLLSLYSDNLDMIDQYAYCLANVSELQNEKDLRETINKLCDLLKRYPDRELIRTAYDYANEVLKKNSIS